MELDKCVLYMKDGSRYVFDKATNITISRDYTGGCCITTNVVHIESHYMKYYPKRTSKRYKKNRGGYR